MHKLLQILNKNISTLKSSTDQRKGEVSVIRMYKSSICNKKIIISSNPGSN